MDNPGPQRICEKRCLWARIHNNIVFVIQMYEIEYAYIFYYFL